MHGRAPVGLKVELEEVGWVGDKAGEEVPGGETMKESERKEGRCFGQRRAACGRCSFVLLPQQTGKTVSLWTWLCSWGCCPVKTGYYLPKISLKLRFFFIGTEQPSTAPGPHCAQVHIFVCLILWANLDYRKVCTFGLILEVGGRGQPSSYLGDWHCFWKSMQ